MHLLHYSLEIIVLLWNGVEYTDELGGFILVGYQITGYLVTQ
jgi:hypothetical protein